MRSRSYAAVRVLQAAVAVLVVAVAGGPAQAAPPPPGSDVDPHNPGLVYRTVTSRTSSSPSVTLHVGCPENYRPFGGGVEVLGATNQVIVLRSQPVHSVTENGFFAAAAERADLPGGDYSGYWQLRVTAVCGPDYPNLTYVQATSATSSTGTKTALAVCPAGRTRVGMGAAIHSVSRAVRFDLLGFGAFVTPGATYPAVANSARAIAGELPSGTSATWNLTAVAVCATPPDDVVFHDLSAAYGIAVEDGELVYYDEASDEPCGGWEPENHSYVTGVGAGQTGDSGEVNLEWFIDEDDSEFGGMRLNLDSGGYSGEPMSTYLGLICVTKAA
jgi:hypothetical protein